MRPKQEPLLFRGTIRENLDPSGNFTDASLWDALQSARLADCGGIRAASPDSVGSRHLQLVGGSSGAERDGKHALCGLETELEGYGSNISAGEKNTTTTSDVNRSILFQIHWIGVIRWGGCASSSIFECVALSRRSLPRE